MGVAGVAGGDEVGGGVGAAEGAGDDVVEGPLARAERSAAVEAAGFEASGAARRAVCVAG